jgi:putative DNA primase/helicase
MKLKTKLDQMFKFKKLLHPSLSAYFQIFSKNKEHATKATLFSGKWTTGTKEKLIKANMAGMEIAMTINRCDGGGRSLANVTEIIAVFVDCDDGAMTKAKLLAMSIPPHAIVETSPGNFHAYWLVKGCDVARFKPIQQALAKLLGADLSVCDASRVMRMPGTINWKRDKPFLAELVHLESNPKRIPIDRFIKKMELTVDVAKEEVNSTAAEISQALTKASKLTSAVRTRIKAALDGVPADERSCWLRFGMAIHSVDSSGIGYNLWTEWSRKSKKFDEKDQQKTWDGFKPNGGVNIETLYWIANRLKNGGDAAFDEMSIAELYAATFKHCLRYDRETRTWYNFAEVVWVADAQAPIRHARGLVAELSDNEKGKGGESLKRFRITSGLKNIVGHAELLDSLRITAKEFDKNPNSLAVKNGVIDLTTGEFHSGCASDYLRRQADVEFKAGADCPKWIAFMKAVTNKDKELYEFIRRALGYIMFGHADSQIFFLAIGSGGNGKGMLMRTVKAILGNYAQSVAPNLLSSAYGGNANSPTPALAALFGARFVICTELQARRKLDDAFIKQYAGGDEISARANYGDVFTFKPEGKLWLSANEMPEISASDEAMWRRLKPIPFNVKFDGAKRDDDLEKKFVDEYPGILNWMLRGATQFATDGLGKCAAVEALEAKMRKASDSVFAWMSECCIKNSRDMTQSSVAHGNYADFTRRSHRKPLSPSAFRASLEEKGFHHKKQKQGNFFEGFRLQA